MNNEELQGLVATCVTFTFGDSETMCDELLHLVRSGKKTATCEALRTFESGSEALPVVGRRDIALNWDGSPALLLETTEVTRRRFCDVDDDFALAEGENDDLDGWRRDHSRYFARHGGFDEQMMLICERFKVAHDFRSQDTQQDT